MGRLAIILIVLLFLSDHISAQPGPAVTAPVYLQDFGQGNANPATIGAPLRSWQTNFSYSTNICPPAGSYTIARRINVDGCFNDEWIPLGNDHTRNNYGMMMIVNNNSDPNDRVVYKDTINKTLCPGTEYRCSVALINIDKPSACPGNPNFPRFELRLEDGNGVLIKKDTTRPNLQYAVLGLSGYIFNDLGFNFIAAAGLSQMVVKLTLLPGAYDCAEDFAVDDIMLAAIGPKININFTGEPDEIIAKYACYQENRNISISGQIDGYYSNPALQWQQSLDNGITWTDIPGATGNIFSRNYAVPGNYLIRLSGADAYNIANPNCRVVSDILQVEIDSLPSGYSITSNSPVCAGKNLLFHADGATSYVWTGPNGFYDNISYPHIYNVTLAASGMYYVDVYSMGGCVKKDSIYVKIIGTDVYAGPDTAICLGQRVQLRSSTGIKYQWTPSTGLSNPGIRNPVASPTTAIEYTVAVTDRFGCTDSAKVFIGIRNKIPLKAMINGSAFMCRAYDSAFFKDMSTGVISSRTWDFDNLQTDTTADPPVQYYSIPSNKDSYLVRLAVTDTAGCTDTAYQAIKVESNCYIAVPSAFTPNNDGVNDYLYPLNAYKAKDLFFRIYDRLGRLVFETSDWTNKWDGTQKGVDQPPGAYVWILEYTDASGKRISLKGTSILIR